MYSYSVDHPSQREKVLVDYPVSTLLQYLPHRGPMVWVDEVIEMGMLDSVFYGSCKTVLDGQRLFMAGDSIKGGMAVEFCAQTYGFAKACFHHLNEIDDTPSVTYLTGVRECKADFSDFSKNQEGFLRTDVKTIRRMENLTFLDGQVLGGRTGTLYASVILQVYTA